MFSAEERSNFLDNGEKGEKKNWLLLEGEEKVSNELIEP